MFEQPTRGAHRAPRQQRRWFKRTSPACGPIPPVPVAVEEPVLPSMDLPDGHLRQRPYHRVTLGGARRYRDQDTVEITDYSAFPAHNGLVGVVDAISGTFRPLAVKVPGVGVIFCAETEVELVQPAPVDADTLLIEAVVAEAEPPVTADWERELLAEPVVEDDAAAELAQYYDDLQAEDAAQPSTSMADKLEYAAQCEVSGNPLMRFEREIMGLPVDADDAAPEVTVWRVPGAAIGAYTVTDTLTLDADDAPLMGGAR